MQVCVLLCCGMLFVFLSLSLSLCRLSSLLFSSLFLFGRSDAAANRPKSKGPTGGWDKRKEKRLPKSCDRHTSIRLSPCNVCRVFCMDVLLVFVSHSLCVALWSRGVLAPPRCDSEQPRNKAKRSTQHSNTQTTTKQRDQRRRMGNNGRKVADVCGSEGTIEAQARTRPTKKNQKKVFSDLVSVDQTTAAPEEGNANRTQIVPFVPRA